jgi:hypothetical protein
MAPAPLSVGFLGDLDDPWVAAIADALPAELTIERVPCAGDVPEEPFPRSQLPRFIIVHRHWLNAQDRARIKRWKEQPEPERNPTIILCISPYVRYEDTERMLGVVDHVIPEGTAADILPGRIARRSPGATGRDAQLSGVSFAIEVSGKNEELCRTLVEVCTRAGHGAVVIDDLLAGELANRRQPATPEPERTLTIWEVPVLEPGWMDVLKARVLETGPLIGLMGFADRASVSQAKAKGAVACLDLPFAIEDLLDSVDRAAQSRAAEHWPLPARAEPPHQLPPRPRGRVVTRDFGRLVVSG